MYKSHAKITISFGTVSETDYELPQIMKQETDH